MLGICAAFLTFKSVDYAVIFGLTPLVIDKTVSFFGLNTSVLDLISFLFF
jgi:NADH-quinone oxidoreductase subunit L